MWYIIDNEGNRIEIELSSTDILQYNGEILVCDYGDSIDPAMHTINDAFLLAYDWFEDNDDWPQVNAYRKGMGCTIQDAFDNWEEAYQGQYHDDEAFAYDIAEQLGAIDKNAGWPMNCIAWEQAARELMYDYFESDGFYFRA